MKHIFILLYILAITLSANNGWAQQAFSPGNVLVNRIGDGSTTLNSAAFAINILEYTPSGTLKQTITSFSGTNLLTESGTATSNGYIGYASGILAVPGYNSALDTANVASSNTKATNLINGNSGGVATRVVFPTGGPSGTPPSPYSGNNFRSIFPTSANTFYTGGNSAGTPATGGVWYYNGSAFIKISNASAQNNVRNVAVFNNQLYFSTGAGTTGIYSLGTGTPTTSGQAQAELITESGMSAYAFLLIDTDDDGIIDRAFIADDRTSNANGGINRWDYNTITSTWTRTYARRFNTATSQLSTAVAGVISIRGLSGWFNKATGETVLYATGTENSNNSLISFTDDGTATPPVSFTTVATAGTNYIFRGVSFVDEVNFDQNRTLTDFSIRQGGRATIAPGNEVTISGTLSNSGTLTIKSNASGTGSLIHSSSGVSATVERYVAGNWSAADAGWHLISSPVASQAISAFETTGAGNGYDFYGWRESDKTWLNYKAGDFSTWNGGTNFVVGRGYLLSYEANQTQSFSGNLNVSDVSVSGLSYTPAQGNGWHLLGNPFVSALEWNKTGGSWSLTNVAGTAKVWNSGTKAYDDVVANGIIPSAQGFFVQVSNATNSLTIPASARIHSRAAWYKNTTPRILLSAAPTDGSSRQESQIRIEPAATAGFDFYHDSRFLEGYAPKFYSMADGEMLSTNALPQIQNGTSIPFGFVKNQHNHFIIRLEESLPGETILLKDLKLNITHDLSQQPEYLFSAAEGDDANRFLLVFGTVGINEKPNNQQTLQAAMHNGQLWVNNPTDNSLLSIHDLSGRLLQQMRLPNTGLQQLGTNLRPGAYIIRLQGNNHTLSAKVINR